MIRQQRDWGEEGVRQQLKVTQLVNMWARVWAQRPSTFCSTSGSTHGEAAESPGKYVANSVTWVLPWNQEICWDVGGKAPRGLTQLFHRLPLRGHNVPPCSLVPNGKGKYLCHWCVFTDLIIATTLWNSCLYFLNFINEETKARIIKQLVWGRMAGRQAGTELSF